MLWGHYGAPRRLGVLIPFARDVVWSVCTAGARLLLGPSAGRVWAITTPLLGWGWRVESLFLSPSHEGAPQGLAAEGGQQQHWLKPWVVRASLFVVFRQVRGWWAE